MLSWTSTRTVNTEHIRDIVQQRLWILSIKVALRSIKNKSYTCRNVRVQTTAPVIADLSNELLGASTLFLIFEVDHFGPFTGKFGQRNEKIWCCLFTLTFVRAVKIEEVPKLDTNNCLNAIMRFIAQRDKPRTIISDNLTNFVGSERVCSASWWMEQRKDHRTPLKNSWKFSTTSLWSIGTVGQKLQECIFCGIAEQISCGCSFKKAAYCWANIECRSVDTSQFRCYWHRSTDPLSFRNPSTMRRKFQSSNKF